MAKLLVIVGPTASGKSELAMIVAKKLDGEIVCADSRTVYKGLDIGTAKPSQQDRQEVPHHLLDVVEPDQNFTVADFKRLAEQTIADIQDRGKLPILVGGSGLYIDAVLFDYGFSGPNAPKDKTNPRHLSSEVPRQRHTKKVWKPNLQTKTVIVDGKKVTMKLSTQAIRTLKKKGLIQPNQAVKAEK